MKRRLLAIDGNSLVFRAYYALPPMINSEGKQVNAIYGFFNMFLNLIEEHDPQYVAVAFDMKAPTFRKKMYDAYKGTRKPTPEDLLEQFPLLQDSLKRLGVRVITMEGYEADDIIGTVTMMAEELGVEAYVYTGDRDAFQLISDNTKVMITKKGTSDIEVYDAPHLMETYKITPLQVIDYKGLCGDTSDNIPGVSGIGDKTATKLLSEYGTIENLYDNLDKLPKNKMLEKLTAGKESAFFSKLLATIKRDVPLDMTLEDTVFGGLDQSALRKELEGFSFKSIIAKLGLTDDSVKRAELVEISDEEALKELIKKLLKEKAVALYITEDEICLSDGETAEYEIKCAYTLFDDGFSYDAVLDKLKKLFESNKIEKIVYDSKKTRHLLDSKNIRLENVVYDVILGEYVLNPTQRDFSIKNLTEKYKVDGKAFSLFSIRKIQEKLIEENDLSFVYNELEMPLANVLYNMERDGFKVDVPLLKSLQNEYSERIEQLKKDIYELAGDETFNISSTKQLGVILFEKLNLPVVKKTKTGYSTDAEVLERLSGMHPIIDKISDYRLITKLKSTYIDGMEILVDEQTNKVHTTFSQVTTATGRISSIEPNLQNIPVRSEFTSHIRKMFIPSNENGSIIAADYSQIELRVLAHISNDRNMIDAFNNDQDIHARTASQIFGVPLDEVTGTMRSSSKAVNFGIVYGISDFGLAKNLGIARYKAEEYINKYLEEFDGVRQYMHDIVEKARLEGAVKTLYGRVRYIPEINAKNFNTRSFGERVALNTPIQGTAADIIKIAMIKVYDELEKNNLKSRLISQVHDELIVDTYPGEEEMVKYILKNVMENIIDLSVPLKVNVCEGKNWSEAK